MDIIKSYKTKEVEDIMLLLRRLDKVTIDKRPLLKPRNKYFLGTVNDYYFNLILIGPHSIDITFKVKKRHLEVSFKMEKLDKLEGYGMYWAIIIGFTTLLILFVIEATFLEKLIIFIGGSLMSIFVILLEKGVLRTLEPSDIYVKSIIEKVLMTKLE